ncbi:MAG: hypothetical protein N2484_12950 [Clostridia bacterium]|nr:hypothetical protein [Clostridia bacterium]
MSIQGAINYTLSILGVITGILVLAKTVLEIRKLKLDIAEKLSVKNVAKNKKSIRKA